MFILTTISDLIQIQPEEFGKTSAQAIKDSINTKYANKVIQQVGVCICLFDLTKSSEGNIGHGTGIVNVNAEFRLLVFRPFQGEIIIGHIKISDPTGIYVSLDFFDDIYIPEALMPEGVRYNAVEKVWVWDTDDSELFYDNNETVRFRVENEHWDTNEERPPYRIIGSMTISGLGPVLWWEETREDIEAARQACLAGAANGDAEMEGDA
ncbi:hypothetical protein BU16DRAFT_525825 [Lophium mytilinum]|uniref:DNA-directed RNA polymerase subunit n=1 Tax=Lophium mytilinum TaxID=390894 RepID=A0A6A6QYF3_9PEZI|nr:hypothetical protein BU16DRAFT_525825 [Lophium mytilinum]